jgi:hypothetical protein
VAEDGRRDAFGRQGDLGGVAQLGQGLGWHVTRTEKGSSRGALPFPARNQNGSAVAPVKLGLQRLMARGSSTAAADEETKHVTEASEDLRDAQRSLPGSCQLDR